MLSACRFVPNSQGEQSPGRLTQQPPQNAQQQQSVQHQEALRALYMQRTAQQIQGANAPVSQAASPLRRCASFCLWGLCCAQLCDNSNCPLNVKGYLGCWSAIQA